MINIDEKLIESLNNLPPLPQTLQKLQAYLASAGSDMVIAKVVEIIEHDPLVTADLLHLSNSAYYGFSKEIKTIDQVIVLLGVNNIKNMMVANFARGSFEIDVSPYGLDTKEFLGLCDKQTDFIVKWLSNEDKKLCHLLIPCIMLLRFGIIIFSKFLIEQNIDKKFLLMLRNNNYEDVLNIEKELLGIDHVSFLKFLFNKWNLDEVFIDCVSSMDYLNDLNEEVKKSAYAVAIIESLFSLHPTKDNKINTIKAYKLLRQAKSNGVDFNIENFISVLSESQQKIIFEAN